MRHCLIRTFASFRVRKLSSKPFSQGRHDRVIQKNKSVQVDDRVTLSHKRQTEPCGDDNTWIVDVYGLRAVSQSMKKEFDVADQKAPDQRELAGAKC